MTPTRRTLQMLRKQGATVAVVEKFNPGARVRQDLFGCIDIVALEPGQSGVLGIQATTTSNMAARRHKIALEPRAALWMACGNRLQIIGWAKRGPRGKRKVWQASVENVADGIPAGARGGAPRGAAGRATAQNASEAQSQERA